MSDYTFDDMEEIKFHGFTEPEKDNKSVLTLEDKEIAFFDDVAIDMDVLCSGDVFKKLNKSSKKLKKKLKKKGKTSKKQKKAHSASTKRSKKSNGTKTKSKDNYSLTEKNKRIENQQDSRPNISVGNVSINIVVASDIADKLLHRCNFIQELPEQSEIVEVNDEQE